MVRRPAALRPDAWFPERNKPISVRRALSWTNTPSVFPVRLGRIVCQEYPDTDPEVT